MGNRELKIALVHDFLVQQGGAERVLRVLADMYPEAPVFTLLYDEEKMRGMFSDKDVRPSYLQKFPKFLRKRYQWLLPFLLVVPETYDLRDFDLIISSSGAWSKGIVTKLDSKHLAYIHSPMRFIWDYNERYLNERRIRNSIFKRAVFSYLRVWDYLAAQRPEYLIANSEYTRRRIEKYYRRESAVIYPPVASQLLVTSKQSTEKKASDKLPMTSYFLVVSRLSAYKKVDVIIEAFNKLGLPLVVVGEGKEEEMLKKIAAPNVKMVGWKSDEELALYYQEAKALVFAAEEDFGIVPIEAMIHGTPIIAFRKGGLLETVEEGVTGEFFDAQTPEVLADGVRRFMEKEGGYDEEIIKKRAEKFSRERFENDFRKYIEEILKAR